MKTTIRVKCAQAGCGEWARYEYDTKSDAREAALRRTRNPWKCSEHSDPERNLSIDRLEVSLTRTNVKKDYGMFWDGFFGLCSDSAFRAAADDFPEGTKLIVTARIELPSLTTPDAACDARHNQNHDK